jgi:hypothetical protein
MENSGKIENFLDSAQGTAGRPESSQKRHWEDIEKYNEKIEALEKNVIITEWS